MNEEVTSTTRSYSARERMTLLPEDFQPSDDDVICGRGKKCYAHIGNDRFRHRVIGMLDEYRKARSKLDKSKVLSDVVEQVRLNSPRGGFVKQDSDGRWYEVGDFLAREKTSQAFRDALHENYKSSNVAKKKRRQQDFTRGEKPSKRHSDSDIIASRMEKLTFGFGKAQPERRIQDAFDRPTVQLRHDPERSHSFSSERSLRPRLSSGNIEATTELNISELRGVERAFKPFYFRDREGGMDARSEILSRARRGPVRPPQSYSLPTSPLNTPAVFDDAPMDLSHSVPNMHFSLDGGMEPTINEMEAMHHSAPNLYYDSSTAHDMDPIPVDLAVPDLSSKPPARTRMGRDESMTISSSLIESLAKITESAGADENPYEPIPLSPASKRRPSIAMSKEDFPNIDERSLSGAFEEEEE